MVANESFVLEETRFTVILTRSKFSRMRKLIAA